MRKMLLKTGGSIVGFYSETRENLNRVYPYLDEKRMDQFVEDAVKIIVDKIKP